MSVGGVISPGCSRESEFMFNDREHCRTLGYCFNRGRVSLEDYE